MQLIIVSPGYPPMQGGIEMHVGAVARGLAERGVQVEVWSHRPTDGPDVTHDGPVVVRWFRTTRSNRFPVSTTLLAGARRRLAGTSAILHVHSYGHLAASVSLRAPRNVAVAFTPHYHGVGHTPLARLAHVPYRPLGRRLFRRADLVVAVSGAEARLLADREPATAGKLVTIRNGVDIAAIHAAQPFDTGTPVVLVAGRHEVYKRTDMIIQAFGAAAAPMQLVIAGDGPDSERLKTMAARSPRSAEIRFVGRLPSDELRRWQRTAAVVVSMSRHEAFGLVAVEGVAAGARAVLSDVPAHRETRDLLPDGSVRIVETVEALSGAIEQAVAARRSVPVRVRGWHDVVTEHLDQYERLLGTAEPASR